MICDKMCGHVLLVRRRYEEMMNARDWNTVRKFTVLYCEAMDQYYEAHGVRGVGGEDWDNRRRRTLA